MSQFHLLLVKLYSRLGDLPRQMTNAEATGGWRGALMDSCPTELQLISQVAIRTSNMGEELSVQGWLSTWLVPCVDIQDVGASLPLPFNMRTSS